MQIGIIGSGPMAQQLALGWLKAGHTVQIGSRQPEAKADTLRAVTVTSNETVLKAAEVVVIALRFIAVKPFAEQYAELMRNKLVIDISNPFEHLPDNRLSSAEITAQAIGEGARVVAAFKANFWQTLLEPVDPKTGVVRDVHYAGDSDDDKAVLTRLITDLGFQPVDCGALRNARVLDAMAPLLVELDKSYGSDDRRLSWKVLSK